VSDGGYTAVADQLGIKRETLRRWVLEEDVGPDPV
jgi:transposase-like protein